MNTEQLAREISLEHYGCIKDATMRELAQRNLAKDIQSALEQVYEKGKDDMRWVNQQITDSKQQPRGEKWTADH